MVDSYSVWVKPSASSRTGQRLLGVIKDLAADYDAYTFEPHVTVLAGIGGPQEAVLAAVEQASKQLAPTDYRFSQVKSGTFYFQCVFLLVQASAEVHRAHQVTKSALLKQGVALHLPNPEYMPHLSLLYADLDEDVKLGIAEKLGHGSEGEQLLAEGFQAMSLVVLRTDPSDKQMTSWEQIAEFPLSGTSLTGH